MNKPHKHAEFIKAWADGGEIEFKHTHQTEWEAVNGTPRWSEGIEYRIKPEQKPDVVKTMLAGVNGVQFFRETKEDNLKLTFDGETGKLKSAEVINND